MTTEPKFFTKNYVTEDNVFTVSHSSDLIPLIYDRDRLSQWVSSGADDDATQISIVTEFYEGLDAVSRDIDTVFVSNHNLADITIDYWNGSTWVSFGSASSIVTDFNIITGSLVTASKIRLTASATQVADEEKEIGEFMACALALDLSQDMKVYEPGAREMVTRNMLGDGSMHQVFTRISPNRSQKYEARCRFQFITEANMETLLGLKEAGNEVLWQPESAARPEQIFLVHFYGPIKTPYSAEFKGSGYIIDLDLREV